MDVMVTLTLVNSDGDEVFNESASDGVHPDDFEMAARELLAGLAVGARRDVSEEAAFGRDDDAARDREKE